MFTGFIKETGLIEQVNPIDSGAELIIQIDPQFAAEIPLQSHLAIDRRVFTVLHKEEHNHFSYLKFSASNFAKVKTDCSSTLELINLLYLVLSLQFK